MTAQESRSWQPKQLDAGMFQAEISSFALRLAAEGKAAKTIRTYTEAVQWFAATGLPMRGRGRGGKGRTPDEGPPAPPRWAGSRARRPRPARAGRPQLGLGASTREPLTAAGIYQMTARRGRQAGVDVYPHRFRHHFSHTW